MTTRGLVLAEPKKELALAKDEKDALGMILKANEFLIQTEVLEDIIKVKDFASVAQAVARVKHYEEAESSAIKLKLKAERKGGQQLGQLKKDGVFGKGKKSTKLADLGVKEGESNRWQLIAKVPEADFNELMENSTKASQNAILEVAKEFEEKHRVIEETPIPKEVIVKIYNCDFVECPDLKNDSIDFILTDPPWSLNHHLKEWQKLGEVAPKVLKTSKLMVTYTSHMFLLGQAKAILESGSMKYWQILCIVLKGNRALPIDGYFEEWRPAFVFYKDKWIHKEPCTDLLDNDAPEKKYHVWGQGTSAAEQIIRFHSKERDLLFEPFAGGGSFIEAAINQKRNIIACERDKDAYKILKQRFPEACQD